MDVANMTEEVLSDDYEEGEILDEDSLYDNVSSLEEFSGSESESKLVANQCERAEIKRDPVDRKIKSHRKKEHKCKEDSVCRRERTGKHCYARIRKRRPSIESVDKQKTFDYDTKPVEEPKIIRKNNVKSQVNSIKHPTRKPDKKDFVSKDGYHFHRQKSYDGYREKKLPAKTFSNHDNRWSGNDQKQKYRSTSPKVAIKGSKHGNATVAAKSSLLKRLVGSGSMGVKILKEQDNGNNELANQEVPNTGESDVIVVIPEKTETIDLTEDSICSNGHDIEIIDNLDDTPSENIKHDNEKDNNSIVQSNFTFDSEKINGTSENQIMDNIVEGENKNDKKEVESIKSNFLGEPGQHEDPEEWALRIAALRTAVIKKFSGRKKNGLIKKKSSSVIDDSMVDYLMQDFNENLQEDIAENNLKDIDYRNFSNQQPCDMDICDMQSVVIEQDFNNCIVDDHQEEREEGTFKPYTCYSFSQSSQSLLDNSSQKDVSEGQESTLDYLNSNSQLDFPVQSIQQVIPFSPSASNVNNRESQPTVVFQECLKEINSNNKVSRHKKYTRKRNSKKKKRIELKKLRKNRNLVHVNQLKNGFNISKTSLMVTDKEKESQEEFELRELALMSVKARGKMAEGMLVKVHPESQLMKTLHVDINHSSTENVEGSTSKPISNMSSNDAWDDVDEDILRAQLLSSLSSKFPSRENAQTVTSPTPKKCLPTNQVNHIRNGMLKKVNKENVKTFSRNTVEQLKLAKEKKTFNNNQKVYTKKNPPIQPPIHGPKIEKFIISLSNDSDSSEEEMLPIGKSSPDISASIDLLLQEVRNKTELEQSNATTVEVKSHSKEDQTDSSELVKSEQGFVIQEAITENNQKVISDKDKIKEPCIKPEAPGSVPSVLPTTSQEKNETKTKTLPSPKEIPVMVATKTPQGIKHLPAWQQEEYKRLKKQLAEKELLWKAAKSKVLAKIDNDQLKSPGENDENYIAKCTKRPSQEITSDKVIKDPINLEVESEIEEQNNSIESTVDVTPSKKQSHLTVPVGKESWQYTKDFTDMSSMVDRLEKELMEFQVLKNNTARLRKELALAQNKLLKKKRVLVLSKESLENKEKCISAKLTAEYPPTSKPDTTDQQKQGSRELELVQLKFKEVSLRAQFACYNLAKEIKPTAKTIKGEKKMLLSSPKRKLKPTEVGSDNQEPLAKKEKTIITASNDIPQVANTNTQSSSQQSHVKRVFSVSDSESLDPFTPLCPFDMSGVCKDEECKYQHVRAT